MIKQPTILKWAGSKSRIMETLKSHLPAGQRLVEPFAGSCAVMMNTEYPEYLLADINPDLINLYRAIQADADLFIRSAKLYFNDYNDALKYYDVRRLFNSEGNTFQRSLYFLYLNRHCFNGLCRYNREGQFNVPFGKYKSPYFPENEIRAFAEKAQRAIFICCSFSESLNLVHNGDVIYCDPPYLPVSNTADFSSYHTGGFDYADHQHLQSLLSRLVERSYPVIASNSKAAFDAGLYANFAISHLTARRSIGASAGSIKSASEIIISSVPETPLWLAPDPRLDSIFMSGNPLRDDE